MFVECFVHYFVCVQCFQTISTTTLPSKGTSGPKPCQQNAPHSITEPPDPLTVGVKHSDLDQLFLEFVKRLYVYRMI